MRKRRYSVDLQAYMTECEQNYLRLLKLLPENVDEVEYLVEMASHVCTLSIKVKQRCKYTLMLDIALQGAEPWLHDKHFDVRLYDDAKMAEVTGFQRQRKIQPVYVYPNEQMYQQDEKYQQHRFLSECLSTCLENGMSQPLEYVV